ncbi:MAG: trigger factor [Phycisphaerae bacterium]|nr:trigger factor [Phycisphaerae bacterium]
MAEKKTKSSEETKDEVKNIVTISEVGPCKKKVEIEIPAETIHAKLDEKYGELKKDAVVPGFRKGRAPIRLLEKRFGTDVSKQVKLELLVAASEAAIKDNEINTLGEPDIDHEAIELPQEGPMKLEFEVEVRPEFDLPELEGIEIEKPKIEVTDQQVDDEILALRKRAGVWTPKEKGGADEGDQILADVVLVTEGAADHDKRENIEITIRKTGFVAGVPVEDLDKLLKGAKHGDEKKTTVEVPETFYNEELRGKKIDLTIEVKEVKSLEFAELNEDFFKRLGVDDENDLKDKIREQISAQAERQARSAMSEQVYEFLRDRIDFDLPNDVVAAQSVSILQRQYSNMLMQGMAKEQIDEQMDQLKAGSEEQAAEQLKMYFIMDKLADQFEVEVTEEEINGQIAYAAAMRGRRPEKMREELARDGSLAQMTLQIREEKCIEKILEKAAIKEIDKVAKKPAKKPAKKTTKKTAKKEDEADDTEKERKKTTAKRTKKTTNKKKNE